jgi:predicted nucleotide-binding protein
MTIDQTMQKIDKLLQDVTGLMTSSPNVQSVKELDEHLKSWEARASEELANVGLIDAAGRFAKVPHLSRKNDYHGNVLRRAKAKEANLKALREDIKNNVSFWQEKLSKQIAASAVDRGTNTGGVARIFLGHGHSVLWARVQLYLEELGLRVEVWESESREGKHTTEVLGEMLESSGFAVLVVTGEDVTSDGTHRARQNVIHEIGLFQGRLGFNRVALLEQNGIEGCSNLLGLQTIRFQGEDIESTFYRLQKMLKREGLIN